MSDWQKAMIENSKKPQESIILNWQEFTDYIQDNRFRHIEFTFDDGTKSKITPRADCKFILEAK